MLCLTMAHYVTFKIEGKQSFKFTVKFEWVSHAYVKCQSFGRTNTICLVVEVWVTKSKPNEDADVKLILDETIKTNNIVASTAIAIVE